jgi:membrane carboxypeptidase/penicillin-binding protein PbpC
VTQGNTGWQLTWLLWTALIDLLCSERDQIGIVVATANFGHGLKGYGDASEALFQRPLSTLSESELATLVAIAWSPSMSRGNPALVATTRDRLLLI